jgi:hypothetical protein
MKLTIAEKYPPFSDLNSNCIYDFQNYLVRLNNAHVMPAETNVVFHASNKFLQDVDTFIFQSEIAKNDGEQNAATMRWIAIHEMGHMLGLHHKALENMVDEHSVMSYRKLLLELQPYDLEAIKALYPLQSSAP